MQRKAQDLSQQAGDLAGNVKQKVSESAEEAGSESDDILLNLKEQSADLSNRFKNSRRSEKPADELGSIAKDTSEDIMIDVKMLQIKQERRSMKECQKQNQLQMTQRNVENGKEDAKKMQRS